MGINSGLPVTAAYIKHLIRQPDLLPPCGLGQKKRAAMLPAPQDAGRCNIPPRLCGSGAGFNRRPCALAQAFFSIQSISVAVINRSKCIIS